jgi:tetratricopeptide (TPR) repeat protein
MQQPFDMDPDTLFNQALGYLQNGLYDPAQKILELVIQLNLGQHRLEAEAYARMALARLHADQGRLDEAVFQLEEAASALEIVGDPAGQLRVTFEQGELAERQEDLAAARAAYRQALSLAAVPSDAGTARMRLGALEREAGDRQKAIEHYRAAIEAFSEAGNEIGQARGQYELARLIKQDAPEEADRLLAQARETATEWNDTTLVELIVAQEER